MNLKVILLADDDPDDAEIFAEVLAEVDPMVKFYHVEDGLAVLDHFDSPENEKPNVIFLDINMREMNGWQCLTRLKKDQHKKDIPVVIYSTSSHPRDKQTAAELGASAFITKPSDYKILRKILLTITANVNHDLKSAINSLT